MKLTSPAFGDGQTLPAKYTCDGAQISPPLTIVEVPEAAKSLVLILNDPDAPLGTFNHWLVWNLDPKIITLEEGKLPVGVVVGTNSAGVQNYTSPCPPSGEHRYIFKLYALDSVPNLSSVSRESAVMAALDKHVLAETTLTGKYSRK